MTIISPLPFCNSFIYLPLKIKSKHYKIHRQDNYILLVPVCIHCICCIHCLKQQTIRKKMNFGKVKVLFFFCCLPRLFVSHTSYNKHRYQMSCTGMIFECDLAAWIKVYCLWLFELVAFWMTFNEFGTNFFTTLRFVNPYFFDSHFTTIC